MWSGPRTWKARSGPGGETSRPPEKTHPRTYLFRRLHRLRRFPKPTKGFQTQLNISGTGRAHGRASGPELIEVEGKLSVVLDGEEDDPVSPKQVKQEVVVHYELAEIIPSGQYACQPRRERLCF